MTRRALCNWENTNASSVFLADVVVNRAIDGMAHAAAVVRSADTFVAGRAAFADDIFAIVYTQGAKNGASLWRMARLACGGAVLALAMWTTGEGTMMGVRN